ncbi:MAG: PEGA domain-containing protein [Nannocystaceae bacterium]
MRPPVDSPVLLREVARRPAATRLAAALVAAVMAVAAPGAALAAPEAASKGAADESPTPDAPPRHAPPRLKGAEAESSGRLPVRVLILPRREGDPLPSATDQSLRESLRDGLRRAGAALVEPTAEVEADECADVSCLGRLRATVGVTYVLHAALAVIDRDYSLHLDLLTTEDGSVVATFDARCALCGLQEARARVDAGAAGLLAPLITPPTPTTILAVVSDPPGVRLTLDGEALGATPLEREVPPGVHTLRATQEGRHPAVHEVTLREGERTPLLLSLAPDLPPPPPPARPGAWIPLALGVPLTLGGAALLALDGRPRPLGCAAMECAGSIETTWAGAATLAAGAALTTLGAILVHRSRKARAQRRGRP